ncbi:hypothetical protein ACE01C_08710 [Moraxella sp. ZJ171]
MAIWHLIFRRADLIWQAMLWLTLLVFIHHAHAGSYPVHSSGTAYKSIGKFGETVYSQLPPLALPFDAVSVHYLYKAADAMPHLSANHDQNHNPASACQYLKINLDTLKLSEKSGETVYEMDKNGNRITLSPPIIADKIRRIEHTMRDYCHG